MAPVALGVMALAAGLLGCEIVDGFAVQGRRRTLGSGEPALVALRGGVALWLLVLWFGLSGRLAFSAVAATVTVAVFVVISREKQRYLTEPLVFSDIAFLGHIPRHPEMFYLSPRQALGIAGVAVGLGAAIVSWMFLEPRTPSGIVQACLLVTGLGLPLLVWSRPGWFEPFVRPALRRMAVDDALAFVPRVGLLGALMAGTVGWLRETAPVEGGDRTQPKLQPASTIAETPIEAVVVIQSESFMDLRRHGLALSLPHLDALSKRAFAHGRLAVPCFGAYTIRPEFGVITGVPFLAQGLGRFHPYLRPARFAREALPAELQGAGWDTVFAHPHDPGFFGRDRAIPTLGFDRFVGEDAFPKADQRFGPYVSDAAVAARVLAEVEAASAASRPLFIMAVTMECHDPYGPGRLDAVDDPVAQYALHAAHADAMLGQVVAALDRLTGRSIVLFYGDHAPLLPGFEALSADTSTDYLALECGRGSVSPSVPVSSSRKSPDELNALLRNRLGFMAGTERARVTEV